MSKSKARKEQLMLEYKKQRRNKILAIAAGVVVGAAVIAGIVFGFDWGNVGSGGSGAHAGHAHAPGEACG